MEIMLSWYPARDMGAAKKFYGEVLGLKQVFEMEGWAEFSVEFEGEVEEIPGIVRLAAFRDPFGNLLQLAQPLTKHQ
jgi:predicted enzyme related to lactoylglutathione lyase